MSAAPGSAIWLLQHELRLFWRAGLLSKTSTVFLYIALVLMHVVAAAIAFSLNMSPPVPAEVRLLLAAGLLGLVLVMMLSRCLHLVIEALYTRRDMELLLTSPLAPASFIGARALSIAITVTLEFAALLFPFANVFVLMGQLDWLKVYLLVPSFAMLTASFALLIALGMFRVLGPRRTRVFAQIMSAAMGIGFLLAMQAPGMMSKPGAQGLGHLGRQAAVSDAAFLLQPVLLILDGVAFTVLLTVGCGALFVAAVRTLGGPFVAASLLSAAAPLGTSRGQSGTSMVFRSDLNKILVAKEMRLLARDPGLLSQLLQQLLYAVPIGLILWKYQTEGTPWMWLSLILVAGSCASALSWLIFTAEDAPDLLATSPVAPKVILRAKLKAALTPVLVIITVPLFVLLTSHPVFAMTLVFCSAACAVSCALLNAGGQRHRKRAEFNARHKGAPGGGIVELLVIGSWMLLCAAIVWWNPWG